MKQSLIRQFCMDARFYCQLRSTGGAFSGRSLLLTILTSRGLWLLTFHRINFYCRSYRDKKSPKWWMARLFKSFGTALNAIVNKSELVSDCAIQSPVYLSDRGYFMFGAQSVGRGCIIHHHITLGLSVKRGEYARPTIGSDVWIGPDCVIAGKLHIGDGATILPGSYLTHSVPARAVARGNPARIILLDFDNSALRQSLAIVHELAPAYS